MHTNFSLHKSAYALGKHLFRLMILEGEQLLSRNPAVNVKGSLLGKYIERLEPKDRKAFQAVIRNAENPERRCKILGCLAEYDPGKGLALEDTLKHAPEAEEALLDLVYLDPCKFPIPEISAEPQVNFDRLTLRLESLYVQDSQDAIRIKVPFLGTKTYNDEDEATLLVIGVDNSGNVTSRSHDLGKIKQGKRVNYHNRELVSFILDAGELVFPKTQMVTVTAIEKDKNSTYEKLIEDLTEYAVKKIDAELIASGIAGLGGLVGIPVPPQVAAILGSALEGFVDGIVENIMGLFENDNDVMGSKTMSLTLRDLVDEDQVWPKAWNWRFSGKGGQWVTRMNWHLD